MAKDTFPATIFVISERDGNLVADRTTASIEDGEKVATYGLIHVQVMRVTRQLTKGGAE